MTESTDTTIQRLLLTPEEAAESLRISRTLVYELMRSRRLESVRIGSCRRIPVEAVSDFVLRLRLSPASDKREARAQRPLRIWDQPHDVVIGQGRANA